MPGPAGGAMNDLMSPWKPAMQATTQDSFVPFVVVESKWNG
jgi:hypothetical protein